MKRKIFFKIWGGSLLVVLLFFVTGLIVAYANGGVKSYLPAAGVALALSAAASAVASAHLAKRISASVSKRFAEIGESLKSLNAGLYYPLRADASERELELIFKEINALNESTHAYIHREESERRKLNSVLDNVSQAILALNYKRELVFVNRSGLLMFGGAASEKGKGLAYLIDDGALCEEIDARLGEEEFSFTHDYAGKTLSVVGKRVSGEEDERALSDILLFTDVSAEKEIIRQKSEFFANASHELKTPITVMRGLAEILLSKEELEEQEKKQISRIHKESLRMAELISDMLKLSKLERSEVEERVEVDVREVVDEVVAELSERIAAKNLTVTRTGGGKLLADPKKVFELVQNLCSNAVNYNKQDGWIKVELQEGERGLILRVADGGIGVEKEHIPRLCERFYRVDKSRSKKTGGTGLGLAIVKHICALYKAELSIESAIGEGTAVTVKFEK